MTEKPESSLAELNVAIAKALGIPCADNLRKVVLTIQAGRPPCVQAEFGLAHADGLHKVVHQYALVSLAAPDAQEVRDAA